MALVIVFVPDPLKAARELARVVLPGGVAATYMWEFPDGFTLAPLASAMKDLGLTPPGVAECRGFGERRHARDLEKGRAHRDRGDGHPHSREFLQFRRFLGFQHLAGRPVRQSAVRACASAREQLKTKVRERLPIAADGSIVYEAFANAVKGTAP